MKFSHWFHHLFNPHCHQCAVDSECKQCQLLMTIVEREREDKRFLLEQLSKNNEPKQTTVSQVQDLPVAIGGVRTWNHMRRDLERKQRLVNSQTEADRNLSTEELENVLLGDN